MPDDEILPEDAYDAHDGETGDERELAPSAASPGAVRRQKDAQRLALLERERFWKGVLADPVGRRELWQLIGIEAHAFEQRFGCSPNGFPDQQATWFHLGEQMLGQRLYQSLALLDRAGVFLMQDEHDPRFAKPKRRKP